MNTEKRRNGDWVHGNVVCWERRGKRRSERAVAENWGENEKAVAEVMRETPSERREKWEGIWKRNRDKITQTPRLRAPVGTPGETGVRRPDGRKPEACEGTGPGSVGVTGNPVARSEREKHERHVSVVTELSGKRGEYDIHWPGVTP